MNDFYFFKDVHSVNDEIKMLELVKTLSLKNSMRENLILVIKNNYVPNHSLWQIIHEFHIEESRIQMILFFLIVLYLNKQAKQTKNCNCGYSAFQIFFGLINDDINTFHKLTNKKEFWKLFHNLINIKLGKRVFNFT